MKIFETIWNGIIETLIIIFIFIFGFAILQSIPNNNPAANQTIQSGTKGLETFWNGWFIVDAVSGIILIALIIYWIYDTWNKSGIA